MGPNIRTEVKSIVLNFICQGQSLRLQHFELSAPFDQSKLPAEKFESRQLWQNHQYVHGSVIEHMLLEHGFEIGLVHCTDNGGRYQVKVIFRNTNLPDPNNKIQRQAFSSQQLEEVRGLLRRVYLYCHAKYYSEPISNIQIAFLQPTSQSAIWHLTVKDGELCTVLDEDLTPEEVVSDRARNFASNLAGRRV